MTTLAVTGVDLKDFARKLRAAKNGKALRAKVGRALRDAAKPVVADVKASVMAVSVTGARGGGSKRREGTFRAHRPRARTPRGGFGLRATIARGAKSSVRFSGKRVGLRIFMDNSHMPRSQRNLPSHLDNPRGWRHPVFGNRSTWVTQRGEPYFRRVMVRHTPRVREVVRRAVSDALRELQ